ncbi:hypothetical protein QT397_00030 (plasmid) [Microbulbifer sp. MKSA007]|nr:hypothetical protein QT397_00030 [Microbulbifer sp. MKSA007]
MQGVEFIKSQTGSFCFTILEVSDDLKTVIRERLSDICNGAAKASRNPKLYSYQKTLASFFTKFDRKAPDTQKGIIGELLTHILFLHYEKEFRAASPHFNLEEDSIKKGFDLVLHHNSSDQIWFVEVKAGECGDQTSKDKLGSLLSLAKNGLKAALNSDRNTLWQNAINGATVVIKENRLKDQLETLLETFNEKAIAGRSKSADYNAILVAVSYTEGKAFATGGDFEIKHQTQKSMNEFNELMSIALQKDTFQSIADFLRGEIQSV